MRKKCKPILTISYIVFIDLRIGIADRYGGEMMLKSNADLLLVTGTYLRVRYDGRKK